MAFLTPEELKNFKSAPGRLLGLDVGDGTLGLALSDAYWMIASPGVTLKRSNIQTLVKQIHHFLNQEPVYAMVVGLPRNLDGSSGSRAKSVKDFTHALSKHLLLPYIFWDERFSTLGAERCLKEADLSYKKRNQKIDAVAAAYILQGYLDYCGHFTLDDDA